jgi:hypothetical protein
LTITKQYPNRTARGKEYGTGRYEATKQESNGSFAAFFWDEMRAFVRFCAVFFSTEAAAK